jgi:hypothetical protein
MYGGDSGGVSNSSADEEKVCIYGQNVYITICMGDTFIFQRLDGWPNGKPCDHRSRTGWNPNVEDLQRSSLAQTPTIILPRLWQ